MHRIAGQVLAGGAAVLAATISLSACGGGSTQVAATVTATVTAPSEAEASEPTPDEPAAAGSSAEPNSATVAESGFWIWSEEDITQLGPELWVYGDPKANSSSNTADSLIAVMQYDMDYDCKPKVSSSEFVPDMIHCGGEGVVACFNTPDEAFEHARSMVGFSDDLDARLVIGNCNMTLPEANTSATIAALLDETAYLMPFLVTNQELQG